MPLHPADRVVDRLGMRADLVLATTAGKVLDRRGSHVDGEQ